MAVYVPSSTPTPWDGAEPNLSHRGGRGVSRRNPSLSPSLCHFRLCAYTCGCGLGFVSWIAFSLFSEACVFEYDSRKGAAPAPNPSKKPCLDVATTFEPGKKSMKSLWQMCTVEVRMQVRPLWPNVSYHSC